MQQLVSKRPNCIAVGLGNSRSSIDTSILEGFLNTDSSPENGKHAKDDVRYVPLHLHPYLTAPFRVWAIRMDSQPSQTCQRLPTPQLLLQRVTLPLRCRRNLVSPLRPSEAHLDAPPLR
jgi:hypothetical protein